MAKIYKLQNQFKHYEWGSCDLIPEFLGVENSKKNPYAEMWIGTNRGAPSKARGIAFGDELTDLLEISGELPFIFKLLGVEKPLSIQAHPNQAQAAEGFKREEMEGLSLNSPRRNYKDPNQKSEILCALSPFTLMAAFRKPDEIRGSLEELISRIPQIKEIITTLSRALRSDSLKDFFQTLFSLSYMEIEYITEFINEIEIGESRAGISLEQWKLTKELARLYPKEVAILAPLFLNFITLEPGQFIFIPPGTLHSYISGFGVELMTNSDNVLRCGLTPKHTDIKELIKILDFKPCLPAVSSLNVSSWSRFSPPDSEFTLAFARGDGGEKPFPEKGPVACVVVEGELRACGTIIKKGESFFIPKDAGEIAFSGNYALYAALAPKE